MPKRGPTPDPEVHRIIQIATDLLGLTFPPNRIASAEQGVQRAMARSGAKTPAQFRNCIQHPGPDRDMLISELTIGESYFLREPTQFDYLRNEVLPEMAKRHGPGRPLRVWSAACASGEEPYSIAILLRELGWTAPVQIVGTDVAASRLASARRGLYSQWALRGVPEHIISRYFTETARGFQLDASIRKSVEFAPLNLIEDVYPNPALGLFGMDLIFCRNVMIYFELSSITQIARRLVDSLSADGWLFLGASDPPIADLAPARAISTGAGLAYRKLSATAETTQPWHFVADAPAAELPVAVFEPVPETALAEPEQLVGEPVAAAAVDGDPEQLYRSCHYLQAAQALLRRIAAGVDTEAARILLVRSFANAGLLREADEACVAALDRYAMSAELFYLHSTLLSTADLAAEAAVAARRALYLNSTLVVAHMALGDALARMKDVRGARLAFRNAENLLTERDESEPVRAADGESAARLLQIARVRRSMLGGEIKF